MVTVPDVPVSPEQTEASSVALRYEDIAQDGRLRIEATQVCMGAVWRGVFGRHPVHAALRTAGIVPVLRRWIVLGSDVPLSVLRPVTALGRWGLTAVRDDGRFLLDIQSEVVGVRGDTYGRPVARGGAEGVAAVVHGEHVLTRLFAPADQRRVTSLPTGVACSAERDWVADENLLEVDGELVGEPHARTVRFGLTHTDSNQHVNSIVYPRLFEELAVEAWSSGDILLRELEITWRKPCFAGEQVRFEVQRVRRGDRRGVIGTVTDGSPRPRCCARLWLW